MNKKITESIVEHIFSSLMIIPSDFINYDKTKSLLSKDFLLSETLDLEDSGVIHNNKIWACQSNTGDKKITLVVANCSIEKDVVEYALVTIMDDLPSYGCYLVANKDYDSEALIACSLNGKEWLNCSVYLQGTFLAGMEQMKELMLNWKKVSNFDKEVDVLKSFLDFHNATYGENNER